MTTRKGRRKKKRLNWGLILFTSVILAAATVLSIGEYANLPFSIPSWNELFAGEAQATTGEPIEGGVSVHVIDVGQADSILIQSPEQNVLIDAGENGSGDAVVNYLRSHGVLRVDLLIATHPHADHIGGMDEVVQQMEIGTILMAELPDDLIPTSKTYTDLLDAISQKGLKIKKAVPGQLFDLGDGATLTVLGPVGSFDDLNNFSIVTRLAFGEQAFVFTGDAEAEAEQAIVQSRAELSATVLKLGHHGSSTSSSKSFLNAVSPEFAAISVGNGNSYNHPSQKTLNALQDRDIPVYRTDLNGSIIFSTDGEKLNITTEK